MFDQRKTAYRHEFLIFLLYGLIAGCTALVKSIDTRPGVTVTVQLAAPETDPKGIFLVYPGGRGVLFNREGPDRFPRQPHLFTEQGFVVAIVDAPSDHFRGMEYDFRLTKEHAEDAGKIIDSLSQKWPKPIFLLGHSSGGVSVTHIAATLKDPRIAGIVVAATPWGIGMPLARVPSPILRVHHRDDFCALFPERPGRRVRFIEVSGGDRSQGWNCGSNDTRQSYAHYFFGKEREVVKAITDWAMGKPVPNKIGP